MLLLHAMMLYEMADGSEVMGDSRCHDHVISIAVYIKSLAWLYILKTHNMHDQPLHNRPF